MTTQIVVPALGESVTEATIAKWLKAEGEAVQMDEPLVELETDKITLEVPAAAAGMDILNGRVDGAGRIVGRLITIGVDERETVHVRRHEHIHVIQVDDDAAGTMNVRHRIT